MVGRKRKGTKEVLDVPIDLASRIGMPGAVTPAHAAPEPIRRHDGPIESEREARGRPLLIGANEPDVALPTLREPARPTATAARPMMIGLEEALATPPVMVAEAPSEPTPAPPLVSSAREAPGTGEMDLVVPARIGRERRNLVTEGRDQGTVVFPKGEFKFYLDATPQERARRRAAQLRARGEIVDVKRVDSER